MQLIALALSATRAVALAAPQNAPCIFSANDGPSSETPSRPGEFHPEHRVARGSHPPPAPTDRSVRFSRTTLVRRNFTAPRERCYPFESRFHGWRFFSLHRRPILPLNGAHVSVERLSFRWPLPPVAGSPGRRVSGRRRRAVRAGLRPPLKLHVRISRMQLSRRLRLSEMRLKVLTRRGSQARTRRTAPAPAVASSQHSASV